MSHLSSHRRIHPLLAVVAAVAALAAAAGSAAAPGAQRETGGAWSWVIPYLDSAQPAPARRSPGAEHRNGVYWVTRYLDSIQPALH
jgi:hypothetical protein